MDAARAEAARIASEAKQASARDTEAKVKKAADKLGLKIEASEKKLAEAVQSAHAEIEAVAAELTQDLVSRLTGLAVDKQDAATAVKAELNV
jgi:F-type H+-transporting ATPase subunit b